MDVRLIAATNQPLEQRVNERLFRADLYHCLNVIRLEIPPLRKRMEDLAQTSRLPGSDHFLQDALDRGWTLMDVERAYIRHVLDMTAGNKIQAARRLGVNRSTLYRKLG